MADVHSPNYPKGETLCSVCWEPCQNPATHPCGHNFCHACSSQFWEDELKEKVTCSTCRDIFLKNKPNSKEPLEKMAETTRLMTVDETKHSAESVCEIHKEALNLFCVEDQKALCSVCRKSWDHVSHTVVPRNQAAKTENQGTESPLSGWEDGFPTNSAIVGFSNMATAFKGKETLDGNADDTDKLVPLEQWHENVAENKEEGRQSNSRSRTTWILLVLFIIQIVGLATTIFVFTRAKPDLPAAVTHCCAPGWIMSQGNCYRAVELEGDWAAGQQHCASLGAFLAVIENLEKLNVAVHNKGPLNHWVGLHRETEESWKWPDGTVFNNRFEVEGDGRCAYLSNGGVSSADCSVEKKCLCSRKVKRRDGSHGECRAT